MICTVICTFIASSEVARTFKVQSGVFHSDHSKLRSHNKAWRAGVSLPAFEELVEGCFLIAEDAAETGYVVLGQRWEY